MRTTQNICYLNLPFSLKFTVLLLVFLLLKLKCPGTPLNSKYTCNLLVINYTCCNLAGNYSLEN